MDARLAVRRLRLRRASGRHRFARRRHLTKTIGESLADATLTLRPSDSARVDARALLGALLGKNGAWLIAHADDPLEPGLQLRFAASVARRAGGEPVPYILGEAGFYGRRFSVTPDVLVPRPESEQLIGLAIARSSAAGKERPLLCDAGTGSGVLAVTLAAEIPRANVVAIDASPAALTVARRNARAHGVQERVTFVLGNVRETLGARYDGIVANLPYVATHDLAPAPDPTAFEPRLALDGGADGLAVYRDFLTRARDALAPAGWLLMEAGPDTLPELARLAREAFGVQAEVSRLRDYGGLERIVAVRS